jgi:NTP pyrophosphatase (non-canonical NTP hydrolase)
MSLAATLRAITAASAHMPATPTKTLQRIAEHAVMAALVDVESIKKWMRRTADRHTTDLADPEARTYILLGLLGEIGELVTEALRSDPDRAKIVSEAGDVLWSLDGLLAQHGATLDDAVAALEHKMLTRPTTSPRMAAAGYRPAPTTIAELRREPGWYGWVNGAAHDLGGPLWLFVEGARVAIVAKGGAKDSGGRTLTSATHPTHAAAVRAALDIVGALNPR